MEMAVGILIVCISDITDPLYLPLKRGGPVCPLLESPLECLVDVYKTLSINFSASKQTASPPLGETGEGFHNVELCIFEITDPLYLPLKWGGPVCPHLESPRNLYKSLSVSLFSKKSNCLSLFRGDGRGVP